MQALHAAGVEHLAEPAELLTSEVVTNAILHARTEIILRIMTDGDRVRIEVADSSPILPSARHYQADAATGRGLGLVEMLATDWGTDLQATGKHVWFELKGDDEQHALA